MVAHVIKSKCRAPCPTSTDSVCVSSVTPPKEVRSEIAPSLSELDNRFSSIFASVTNAGYAGRFQAFSIRPEPGAMRDVEPRHCARTLLCSKRPATGN